MGIKLEHQLGRLPLGDLQALQLNTEVELIDVLQRIKRPITDVSFLNKKNALSKAFSCQVQNHVITAAASSPIHLELERDPQYTLVFMLDGSGKIQENRKEHSIVGGQIFRSSYANNQTFEYQKYLGVTISTDLEGVMREMQIEPNHCSRVRERLLNIDTEEVPTCHGKVNYDAAFRSLFELINNSKCDAQYLERIGIGSLLTKMIASLTLALDPELATMTRSPKLVVPPKLN